MRSQANLVDFVRPFIADIGFHDVLRENIALEKELVIALKGIERFVERFGSRWNVGAFLRRRFPMG